MDDEKGKQDKAIDQILKIRKLNEENKSFFPKIKPKTILKIDLDCKCWSDLVQVCQIEVEPPTTICFSSVDLINAKESELVLQLTYLPNNSQSVECAVKSVTEISKLVYGLKKRHNFILTKDQSRKENHRNVNKTNYFIPNK